MKKRIRHIIEAIARKYNPTRYEGGGTTNTTITRVVVVVSIDEHTRAEYELGLTDVGTGICLPDVNEMRCEER